MDLKASWFCFIQVIPFPRFELQSKWVIPFPLFELQSKWVAGVLSGRIELQSKEEMMKDVKAFYLNLESRGCPKRYIHSNFLNYQVACPSDIFDLTTALYCII
jgi:hypothetical protein